jgi:hypothetical protein
MKNLAYVILASFGYTLSAIFALISLIQAPNGAAFAIAMLPAMTLGCFAHAAHNQEEAQRKFREWERIEAQRQARRTRIERRYRDAVTLGYSFKSPLDVN